MMGHLLPTPTAARLLRLLAPACACALVGLAAAPGGAEPPDQLREEVPDRPDGIHVLDGSYVLEAGRLAVNITNHGLIGSHYSAAFPYSNAPSAQWPAGTGDEYLYGAGLWIGAKLGGQISVTTGQPERELRPGGEIEDTIYESYERRIRRPEPDDRIRGSRLPDANADDDEDGDTDEDMLNGYDDDGDGEIDEDYGQIGDQMMTCTMYDDTRLAREIYTEHRPLGVRVVQRAAAWHDADYEDIVALDFEIKNENYDDITDMYLGFYVDCDIQNRSDAGTQPDDLTGYFDGAVRDETMTFHRMQVGWMRDAARDDPLPGVLGVVMLDHTTDFSQQRAPHISGVSTYQRFTTGATVYQGGEPVTDADRYALMARTRPDPDAREDKPDDYRFILSSGPFPTMEPGRTLHYRVAMVIGDGMENMLRTALRASILQRGRWFNLDGDYTSGSGGFEEKVCIGDLPPAADGRELLYNYRAMFMDEYCTGPDPVFGISRISKDMMFEDEDGRTCVWVNADNCEECFRAVGVECTEPNGLYWEMGRYLNAQNYAFVITGRGGREHREAWVPNREVPPPRPRIRVEPGDHRVEVFWDDRAEHEPDYARGVPDFESYRIWRVLDWRRPAGVDENQTPPAQLWNMIAEFDLKNFIPAGLAFNLRERPLGQNTGLEGIAYAPPCLSDPRYAGLADAMAAVVREDIGGAMRALPSLRRGDGSPTPGLERLLPWEFAGDVLDTFFAVTSRVGAPGVQPKRATRYYHYVDDEVPNGFRAYLAVTARDHELTWHEDAWHPVGYGVEVPPEANYEMVTPGFAAQTADDRAASGVNIYVYPNPVTREALAEFDQQEPTLLDATGSRIVFANLPRAHNTITIYTAAGDLVQSIEHDGRREGGQAYWNLMSRNGQEIVSGIYLYAVHTHDEAFDDFVGRFVVVW